MDTENTNQMPIEAEVIKSSGELKFKELWLESWGILKAKWRSLLPWFCLWVVVQILSQITILGMIIGSILNVYVMVAIFVVIMRRNETLLINDIRRSIKGKFWPYIMTSVLVMVFVLGNYGLLYVPGVIVAILFSQYLQVGVYQNIFGMDALWESRKLVVGRAMKYVWLIVAPVLLLALFVAIVVMPVFVFSILMNWNETSVIALAIFAILAAVAVLVITLFSATMAIYTVLIYERLVATYVPNAKVRPLEKAKKMIYWGAGVGYLIIIVFGAGMLYLAITNPELFDAAEPSTLDFEELQGDYMNVPVDQAFKL